MSIQEGYLLWNLEIWEGPDLGERETMASTYQGFPTKSHFSNKNVKRKRGVHETYFNLILIIRASNYCPLVRYVAVLVDKTATISPAIYEILNFLKTGYHFFILKDFPYSVKWRV